MQDYILETCVDSVESAVAAKAGGADRLELCANLIIGGTTPGVSLYQEIRKYTDIAVRALIRPRFGDFCYTAHEFEIIRNEVRSFRRLGAGGVVVGILKPDGTLDEERMKYLMEDAGGMKVTLHRAFDVCIDPYKALQQAKQMGIDTILTSGQQNNCLRGKELLKELVSIAGDGLDIMVGSGVDAEVIQVIQPYTKAHVFHMSGKTIIDSSMIYRKEGVSMGLSEITEYEIWQTDAEKIKEAKSLLDTL